MPKPTLTCWGGVGAVTGANFILDVPQETGSKRLMIDCGLLQGLPGADRTNAEAFDYDPRSIEAVFITHAHIDHIGKVPKLVKDGFQGTIYSTEETKEIATLMLLDMAKISASNAERYGREGLYDAHDVELAMQKWQALPYHSPKDLGGCTVELFNAGHILGSAMYKFSFSKGSILFTGDTGSAIAPLEQDIEFPEGVDYLLMDSVYGDRNHESKEDRDNRFRTALIDAAKAGGTILIPAFSLERTQVLLYELDMLFKSKTIPSMPVFLDSPLAIRVTEIYERFRADYNPAVESEMKNDPDVFKFPKLMETLDGRDSRNISAVHGSKIILAGSGMSNAGRIVFHEAVYLPDPSATIIFAGYQAPGTLGRQIQEGNKTVVIDGKHVPVRAQVISIDGFSAHRDSDGLVDFVSRVKPSHVFVTMGEPKSSIFLAQRLHDEVHTDTIVPERGKVYELDLL